MKETKTSEFKNSVIKHLREQHYNINQPEKDENLYAVFPPTGTGFIMVFKKKYLLVATSFELKNKSCKKLLKFVNDCNNQSQKMKFILKEDGILMLDAILPNIYQKEEFQRFLNDIKYDMNDLLKESKLIIEMPM